MSERTVPSVSEARVGGPTPSLVALLAAAAGLTVANLYYPQTLAGLVAQSLALDSRHTGLIVMVMQAGYSAGLLLIVPLADLVENRRLVTRMLSLTSLALLAMALASARVAFLTAAFVVGFMSVSAQVIIPFAAGLASEARRGRVVGAVTAGLQLGILLAMPAASLIAHAFSWRATFILSAGLIIVLAVTLRSTLPFTRPPSSSLHYCDLMRSLFTILRATPVLRRRAACHAALYGSFILFWTAAPLSLVGPSFGLSQQGVALVALVGAASAAVAPLAGRAADRGRMHAPFLPILTVVISFVLGLIADNKRSLMLLVAAALLLNSGVTANLVLSQRAIFALRPEIRGRLNALFMSVFVSGGIAGSAVAGYIYTEGGWKAVSWVGLLFASLAFLPYLTDLVSSRARAQWQAGTACQGTEPESQINRRVGS